ncbi:MAG: flagellar export chaperone FliS [Anaerovoracaceae bacterium]|jgi:flagellar protein FliS
MQHANLYQQYKAQSLETITKGEVVVKLFEETSKQISKAIFHSKGNDSYQSYNAIAKAQKIIQTLTFSLDMNHAISIELRELYLFLYDHLGKAASNNDVVLLKDLLALVDDLKVAFRQADRLSRMGNK